MDNDRIVVAITRSDLQKCNIPMIAMYKSPDDYPGKYVARLWDCDKPTNTVMVDTCLERMIQDITMNTNAVFLKRGAEDDEKLMGVWII